jgi:hypothetical protein
VTMRPRPPERPEKILARVAREQGIDQERLRRWDHSLQSAACSNALPPRDLSAATISRAASRWNCVSLNTTSEQNEAVLPKADVTLDAVNTGFKASLVAASTCAEDKTWITEGLLCAATDAGAHSTTATLSRSNRRVELGHPKADSMEPGTGTVSAIYPVSESSIVPPFEMGEKWVNLNTSQWDPLNIK